MYHSSKSTQEVMDGPATKSTMKFSYGELSKSTEYFSTGVLVYNLVEKDHAYYA